MSTPHTRTPSARDGTLESLYRSYKASRPNLFHQRPQLRPMENRTLVQIGVVADNQEHIVSLPNTLHDPSLSQSLITKSKALATLGEIETASPIAFTDSYGQAFASSRTITLRWRYESGLQSFQEAFYVVDGCAGYDAMLRQDIETKPDDAHSLQAHPTRYEGHYSKQETRDRDARERENREQWMREMQADREKMKRNIEAMKKKKTEKK